MAATWSTFSAVLKEDYKELVDQMNEESLILAQLKKNSDDLEGLRGYIALRLGRTSAVGARPLNGGASTPTAANQTFTKALIPLRGNYAVVTVPRSLMKTSARDSGAFVSAMDGEMKFTFNDSSQDRNRQCWGTSDGVLATCSTTTSSTTVVLATATTPTQMRHILEAGKIDIGTTSDYDSLTSSGVTVTSIDTSAKTIVVSSAVTTDSTHRISRFDAGGHTDDSGLQGDGQIEMTGIQTAVKATGKLHTVNASTYADWLSYVDSNSGTNRAFAESTLNKCITQARSKSGKTVDLAVSNDGVANAIAADMRSMRRNNDNIDLKGGYKGIRWGSAPPMGRGSNEVAVCWERDCPENTIFGLCSSEIEYFHLGEAEWVDDDGEVWRNVAGTDDFQAYLAVYEELGYKSRNSHFRYSDITAV